ncbi:hypothetical protein AB0D12_04785 [Streptomyces sp. NPDC048479]|uniref:hypothetical protein n=1 Tax=Streptomyces sp. NPDC048479 TaxID=3154725 RepID=UPI0034252770
MALLGAGAGAIVRLSPGGLGEAGATEVTKGASVSAYRSATEAVADAPAWMGSLLEVATEGTLVILGLLLVWLCWAAVRRKDAAGAAGAIVIGVGTIAAYAISEALKLVVDEERPCRTLRGVEAAGSSTRRKPAAPDPAALSSSVVVLFTDVTVRKTWAIRHCRKFNP